MAQQQDFYWVVRAGREGQSEALFLSGLVAIGWDDLGDLEKLAPTRDAFFKAIEKEHPDWSEGHVRNSAGQLYRFVHEMKIGDQILYPSKITREVHYGIITAKYQYAPSESYANRRRVEWKGRVSRDDLAQGVRFELGSSLTLFQLKTYVSDFKAALNPNYLPTVDKTIEKIADDAQSAEQVEESTNAYVLDFLLREKKGYPLQHVAANVLVALGYKVRILPKGPDGGIDLVARRDELEIEPPIIKVQVKSGPVGDPDVSSLCGKLSANDLGLFIALGSYSKRAREFAKTKNNLRLIDAEEFVALLLANYEKLDTELKSSLNLKKVYIPIERN